MMERWKDISGYEGYYQISSQGQVKSLARNIYHPIGGLTAIAERLLIPTPNDRGYLAVNLFRNGKPKTFKIHILVWDYFGDEPRNGRKKQVDHKDHIKAHCWVENLQLLTPRRNMTKEKLRQEKTSQYTGVSWNKSRQKWHTQIRLNGRLQYLGQFVDESMAGQAYQTALSNHLAAGGQ
jgi:hypothetical protein